MNFIIPLPVWSEITSWRSVRPSRHVTGKQRMHMRTWISQDTTTDFSATNMIWRNTRNVWSSVQRLSARMHTVSGKLPRRISGSWEILSGQDGNISERPETAQLNTKTTKARCRIQEWLEITEESTFLESRVQRQITQELLLNGKQVRLSPWNLFIRKKTWTWQDGLWPRLWRAGPGEDVPEKKLK